VLDEADVAFAPAAAIAAFDAADPRVLHRRTFSKAHGMAGARIGYAIAPAAIVAAFDKIRLHYGVNRIAQAGALASLADPAHIQSVVAAVAEGRREYEELARSLGLSTLPSAANFVAIDAGEAAQARALQTSLEEQ